MVTDSAEFARIFGDVQKKLIKMVSNIIKCMLFSQGFPWVSTTNLEFFKFKDRRTVSVLTAEKNNMIMLSYLATFSVE